MARGPILRDISSQKSECSECLRGCRAADHQAEKHGGRGETSSKSPAEEQEEMRHPLDCFVESNLEMTKFTTRDSLTPAVEVLACPVQSGFAYSSGKVVMQVVAVVILVVSQGEVKFR